MAASLKFLPEAIGEGQENHWQAVLRSLHVVILS